MAAVIVPDLPATVTREQIARALAALGIPAEGVRSAEIGPYTVSVTQISRQDGVLREVKTEVPIRLPESSRTADG